MYEVKKPPFGVGGLQRIRPAIGIAATDKPSLRESLGGRKEAKDTIGPRPARAVPRFSGT